MKRPALFAFFFVAITHITYPQATSTPLLPPQKGNLASTPKAIENYREVLSQVPAEIRRTKATAWTQAQKAAANVALKEALVQPKTPAKLRVKVSEVANWPGLTLFSEVPNREGYHVRIFGVFGDDWKPKLTALKKGDSVLLEGVLSSVTFQELWGSFTLSINLQNCIFTK